MKRSGIPASGVIGNSERWDYATLHPSLLNFPPPPVPTPGGGAANDPIFKNPAFGGGGGGCPPDCSEWKKGLDNLYGAIDKMKRTSGILWNATITLTEEGIFRNSVRKYEAQCGPYTPPYPKEPNPETIHDIYGK